MIDISNEGLLNQTKNKKANMLSFDSISEKQEESSNSSNKNSKINVSKTTKGKKSILKRHDTPKDGMNVSSLSIKKQKTPNSKKKSIKIVIKEEEKDKYKNFFRGDGKKKTIFFVKRTSFQSKNFDLFTNQLKNNEGEKKRSSKNMELGMNKTILKEKRSLNVTLNNKKASLSSYYNNHSVFGQTTVKNKSINLSNSDLLDMKYFNKKKLRGTILRTGKLNFKEKKELHSSHLFEKLKESYLFEKSEALLFKIKICYGFLAVFSFLSILLEIIDVIVFNNKTNEYLEKNYNISLKNNASISNYYFIEEREISNQENTIRIFNSIFSILCFLLHLKIHKIKKNFNKQKKKKKKKKEFYRRNYNRRKTTKSTKSCKEDNNKSIGNDRIKIVLNDDFVTKNYVTREEIIKLVINCIISLVFFPPRINKIFIGVQHDVIYVFSLNSIILVVTFCKLINVYFALYYLSPFNNLLYKTICSSNMVKMNFLFMFRFLLNLYPKTFIIINFLIISLVICIIIYCTEFFTINISNGIWNNKGMNDLKNFYNLFFLYSFFSLKSIHGNIKAETILGTIILILGGAIGTLILSYLIFYINQFIEFRPEEQQAYSKLEKLLNPLNNEHKAANLIKIFLLMKKMYIDNINIEKEYLFKKEKHVKLMLQKNFGFRKSHFNFGLIDSNNSITSLVENNDYKEKRKFLKFIGNQFVLKTKIINESKNFKNILLIARNNSLSLNDVLKTLGDKMNGNMNQLNNKIDVLIQNDTKFKNFMKFQINSIKKIAKINEYQKYALSYLIDLNNEISVGYLKDNKEKQNNFINKYKHVSNGGLRRLKSTLNGPFFGFGRKIVNKKTMDNSDKHSSKKSSSKGIFDNKDIVTVEVKRLKSSIMPNKSIFHPKNDVTRSNTNPIKTTLTFKSKNNIVSSKSFDESILKICKNRKDANKLESTLINTINRKSRSLSGKKKEVIEKWKNKLEK